MAILFCDGFDHYASADLALKYSSTDRVGITAGAGRYGTAALQSTSDHGSATRTMPSNYATCGLTMAFKMTVQLSSKTFMQLLDSGSVQIDVRTDTLGTITVTRAGTVLGTASAPLLYGGAYNHIELKVTIHGTTGTVDLWLNSTLVLSLTGVNTKATANAWVNGFTVGGYGNQQMAYDDVVFWDNSGSVNNDHPGDVRVQAIFPTGAGSTTQMTPSAGSNYACVDEAAPNGDTDYVSETTAGEKDTYAFGNLTPTSGTVLGVQVLINARKDDAGSRTIAPVYRPSSTDYDGTNQNVLDSYAYAVREITEVSPATSSAWTISEINGAEFGVKLVS